MDSGHTEDILLITSGSGNLFKSAKGAFDALRSLFYSANSQFELKHSHKTNGVNEEKGTTLADIHAPKVKGAVFFNPGIECEPVREAMLDIVRRFEGRDIVFAIIDEFKNPDQENALTAPFQALNVCCWLRPASVKITREQAKEIATTITGKCQGSSAAVPPTPLPGAAATSAAPQ